MIHRLIFCFVVACTLEVSICFAADKVWWGGTGGSVGDYGVAANWQPSGVPGSGDNVYIPVGSNVISGTLNQSGVSIGTFIVEDGYDSAIGTFTSSAASPSYLQIDCTSFTFGGTRKCFIELAHSGAINANVRTADISPTAGEFGLYLQTDGSGTIGTLTVASGYVAFAAFGDDPAQTVANLRVSGSSAIVLIGPNATTTNVDNSKGSITIDSDNTIANLESDGGTTTIRGIGAITAATVNGGTLFHNGSGTATAVNVDGGTFTAVSGPPKTITTLTWSTGTVEIDPELTTVTNLAIDTAAPYQIITTKD